jgi:hypothetical membrane protein
MNVRIVRLMGWFGIVAPFIAALMIYVSAGSTPGWSMTEQTLSQLGSGGFGAVLFNSGLAMAGSVMLLFGAALYEFSDGDTVGRIGTALYLLSSGIVVGLSLVTIEVQPLHDLAAIVLFVALPLSAAVSSVYAWRMGLKPYAVIGFAAAVISMGVWAVAGRVTALYEVMALAPIGLWQMALGYWMCSQESPDDDL